MRLFGRWPQSGLLNNPNVDLGVVSVPVGDKKANIMFWGGFGIFSGTKHPEAAWRFLKYYVGEGGSKIWIKHGIPPVASVVKEAGMDQDPIEGVWIKSLEDVADRAYVYSDYWGETGAPALGKALEKADAQLIQVHANRLAFFRHAHFREIGAGFKSLQIDALACGHQAPADQRNRHLQGAAGILRAGVGDQAGERRQVAAREGAPAQGATSRADQRHEGRPRRIR
jgi:hypothetical protein